MKLDDEWNKSNKTNNPHGGTVAFLGQAELVRLPDAWTTPHSGQYEHMLCSPSLIYLFSRWNSQATVGNPSLFTTPELVCRSENKHGVSRALIPLFYHVFNRFPSTHLLHTSAFWIQDNGMLGTAYLITTFTPSALINQDHTFFF